MKRKRKHKFRLIIKSRITGWTAIKYYDNYKFASSLKKKLEESHYKVISSVI